MIPNPKLIEKCPKCGSTHLIEDDGIQCQDCDWKEENEEDDWEEDSQGLDE